MGRPPTPVLVGAAADGRPAVGRADGGAPAVWRGTAPGVPSSLLPRVTTTARTTVSTTTATTPATTQVLAVGPDASSESHSGTGGGGRPVSGRAAADIVGANSGSNPASSSDPNPGSRVGSSADHAGMGT